MPSQPGKPTISWQHPMKHGQQVKGGDPASLFHAVEASPVVLHPDVESSVQERHKPVGNNFQFPDFSNNSLVGLHNNS